MALASLVLCPAASAAVGEGGNKRLEAAGASQGGPTVSSSKYRQQSSIGEAIAGTRITSSKFRIVPGFLGAAASSTAAVPVSGLDIAVLYAKTDAFGDTIPAQVWQRDRDPLYLWEHPVGVLEVAGYSYAIDGLPDDTIDTTSTTFDIATSEFVWLPDGVHTFTVKALNSAGNSGAPATFEIWIDTTPPSVASYTPAAGALLNLLTTPAVIMVSEVSSGVDPAETELLVNGAPAATVFDQDTGRLATSSSTLWTEGANSLELRLVDLVGNAATPLVWSFTIDATPPSGTLVIHGGAASTTSVYVTLSLDASDAVSGVTRMLLSNEEAGGYVDEPYAAVRELWRLNAVRGLQSVYVKFVDAAGNTSAPVSDTIDLLLTAPETVITAGPVGLTPSRTGTFSFLCPEGGCVFSYAFDHEAWSAWSEAGSATAESLSDGNHYFRVRAARETNGLPGIQDDETDPSPAERTWAVGLEPPPLALPQGPPIKLWRLE